MKNRYIFWGTFLIFLGIFILMNNFGIFKVDSSEILVWWPVLLIFWGATLLKIPEIAKLILSALAAVLFAFGIVTFFAGGMHAFDNIKTNFEFKDEDAATNCTNYEEELDSAIKYGTVNFSGGAGKFDFNSTNDYFYYLKSGTDECSVVVDRPNDSTAVLNYSFDDAEVGSNNSHRYSNFEINKSLIWDVNISAGASKMDINLDDLIISDLNIDAGASDTDLKLGANYPLTKVKIDCGAANFRIAIPQEAGCSVQGDMALTKLNFEGLKQNSAGVYISDNYYKSNNKIDFYIDGALSKVQISRK
jgi:hypothetical protein